MADASEDDAVQELVATVVSQLPEDVRVFAVERCSFTTLGSNDASAGNRLPVTLADANVDENTVRHAVAQAWLGESGGDAPSETEIAELVASWEFTGPGEDA